MTAAHAQLRSIVQMYFEITGPLTRDFLDSRDIHDRGAVDAGRFNPIDLFGSHDDKLVAVANDEPSRELGISTPANRLQQTQQLVLRSFEFLTHQQFVPDALKRCV